MFKILHDAQEHISQAGELVEDFLTRIFGATDLVPEGVSVEEVPEESDSPKTE